MTDTTPNDFRFMMLQYGLNTNTAAKMFQKSMGGKQVKSGYLNNEILEKIGFDDVTRVGILSVFEDMRRDDEINVEQEIS